MAVVALCAAFAVPAARATECDFPRNVALFINTSYVDWGSFYYNEAFTMQQGLLAAGHTVSTFTATNGAGVTAALTGMDVVVIPELERCYGCQPFDAGGRAALSAFVDAGGVMIACYPPGSTNMVNGIFGWSMGGAFSTGTYYYCDADAFGTTFDGSPGTLPYWSATGRVYEFSLPADALKIYTQGPSCAGDSFLTQVPYGDGIFVYMGWDWFNAAPPGSYDAGWVRQLDLACCAAAGAIPPATGCGLEEIEAKLDDEFRFTDDDEAREWRDEVNSQLAALEAKADEMGTTYCDVVRILHTPSGIRTADCGGQHYEWNDDGTLHD